MWLGLCCVRAVLCSLFSLSGLLCPSAPFCCVSRASLAGYLILQVRFLPSVPLPSSPPSSALPCPALPYRTPSPPGSPRPNPILCCCEVTLLAFSLFGLWLAGPLGNQPKAPSPHPSKLQARMPRARAPGFGFVGGRNATNAIASQHQRLPVPGTSCCCCRLSQLWQQQQQQKQQAVAGGRRGTSGRGCRSRVPRALLELGTQLSFLTGGSP